MTREERIEAAIATVGKATDGPWELFEVGHKLPKKCPAHDGMSILTVKNEGNKEFGAVYEDADAELIAAAPDLRDEVIALRAQVEKQRVVLLKVKDLYAEVRSIEQYESYEGGSPDIGTARTLGKIKQVAWDAKAAIEGEGHE